MLAVPVTGEPDPVASAAEVIDQRQPQAHRGGGCDCHHRKSPMLVVPGSSIAIEVIWLPNSHL
jgi:hypothetical protein